MKLKPGGTLTTIFAGPFGSRRSSLSAWACRFWIEAVKSVGFVGFYKTLPTPLGSARSYEGAQPLDILIAPFRRLMPVARAAGERSDLFFAVPEFVGALTRASPPCDLFCFS